MNHEKYQTLSRSARKNEVVLTIPPKVCEEVTPGPAGYTTSNVGIDTGVEQGWIELREVDFENGTISNIMDETRRRIASKTDRPERQIEQTDAEVVGLAAQMLIDEEFDKVRLYTPDKPMGHGEERR